MKPLTFSADGSASEVGTQVAELPSAMTHALQVHFRQLVPNEGLIALAAERYRQMRSLRAELGECQVSLEQRDDQMTHAVVMVSEAGNSDTKGSASHCDPQVALDLALKHAHAQLGLRSIPREPYALARCFAPSDPAQRS